MRVSDFDRNGVAVATDMVPCLSIRQPYAWLIVQGIKPVENRTWATKFRGRVLIHAGVTYPKRDHRSDLDLWGRRGFPQDRESMLGGIVGEAVIVDCVREHPSEFFFGPYGFVLEQPKAYPRTIPFVGRLGFFSAPVHVLDTPTGSSNAALYDPAEVAFRRKTDERPPYCGSGHCSCIECPYAADSHAEGP